MAATEFDFTTVSVETAEMPSGNQGRNREYAVNPFLENLTGSYEDFKAGNNAGRQIQVPGKNAPKAVYLIRQAADDLGVGSRCVIQDSKGETLTIKEAGRKTGQVTVLFSAKNRRTVNGTTAETAPESDAE